MRCWKCLRKPEVNVHTYNTCLQQVYWNFGTSCLNTYYLWCSWHPWFVSGGAPGEVSLITNANPEISDTFHVVTWRKSYYALHLPAVGVINTWSKNGSENCWSCTHKNPNSIGYWNMLSVEMIFEAELGNALILRAYYFFVCEGMGFWGLHKSCCSSVLKQQWLKVRLIFCFSFLTAEGASATSVSKFSCEISLTTVFTVVTLICKGKVKCSRYRPGCDPEGG